MAVCDLLYTHTLIVLLKKGRGPQVRQRVVKTFSSVPSLSRLSLAGSLRKGLKATLHLLVSQVVNPWVSMLIVVIGSADQWV